MFLHHHAASPDCVYCGAVDTVAHAAFDCEYSRAYWAALRDHLASSLSDGFDEITFAPGEILLGLPTLSRQVDKQHKRTLRAVVAVALQGLHESRYSRIRTSTPSASSPSPVDLASSTIRSIADRL
ncbi:hypothetical protein JCM1840_001000 [Sporobolomyces johnsonii]